MPAMPMTRFFEKPLTRNAVCAITSRGFVTTTRIAWRHLDGLLDRRLHDFVIGLEQIVTAHAGLAWEARRQHDDVGVRGVSVAVGALDAHVATLDRTRLEQVEAFALRDTLQDVDHHHVGKLLVSETVRHRRPHVPRAHHSHFLAHASLQQENKSRFFAKSTLSDRARSLRKAQGRLFAALRMTAKGSE